VLPYNNTSNYMQILSNKPDEKETKQMPSATFLCFFFYSVHLCVQSKKTLLSVHPCVQAESSNEFLTPASTQQKGYRTLQRQHSTT